MILANDTEQPIEHLHCETDIVSFVRQMVNMINKNSDDKETSYCMGLEICWLMTNVACGPEEITKELFYQIVEGSLTEELPVVTLIQRFLTSGTQAQ